MRQIAGKLCLALSLLTLTFASLLYSNPTPDITGEWEIKGTNYKGTMKISEKNGNLRVYADAPRSYNANAEFDGKTLKFSRSYHKKPGLIWRILNFFGAENKGKKVTVEHSYSLLDEGRNFKGQWKSSEGTSGEEKLVKIIQTPVISAIEPATLEADKESYVVTIKGKHLPQKAFASAGDFWFTPDNRSGPAPTVVDEEVKVAEILEVSDDRTHMKVKLTLDKKIREGTRLLHLKEAEGKAPLTITRPVELIPLGQEKEVMGEWAKVYVPNSEGGKLELSGSEILKLRKGSKDGEEVKGKNGTYEVSENGYYFVQFKDYVSKAKAEYTMSAKTPEEKTPWTFWYFPYKDRFRSGQNLYDDGGVYEKLDRVLDIKGKKDGWKDFKPYRHIDSGDDLKIDKLKKKYYKNGKWETPDDESDKKFLMRHDPSTMKGFAWCYQRSEDSDKGWWGHCWGAVVASSLYAEPEKGITVKDPEGKEVKFSQEEVEGILTSYYTDHGVFPTSYMNDCPSGLATDKKDEPWDSYCDDYMAGLIEGIGRQGLPLASDLRASSRDEKKKTQIWNHVVYRYEAKVVQAKGTDDPTVVELELKIWASADRYPSSNSSRRTEEYTMVLQFGNDGRVQRDSEHQNWISTSHFTPQYLWRIERSSGDHGTKNEVMRGKFDKLNKLFDFKRIK